MHQMIVLSVHTLHKYFEVQASTLYAVPVQAFLKMSQDNRHQSGGINFLYGFQMFFILFVKIQMTIRIIFNNRNICSLHQLNKFPFSICGVKCPGRVVEVWCYIYELRFFRTFLQSFFSIFMEIPVSFKGILTNSAWYDLKAEIAPMKQGFSTRTVSPGSTNALARIFIPWSEPVVINNLFSETGSPFFSRNKLKDSRRLGSPCVGPYCIAACFSLRVRLL